MALHQRTILLIVSGGIAAYKACALVRLLKQDGAQVLPVLTPSGAQFITPLSLATLAESPCYTDLFSLTAEAEMGHIQLSRRSDLVVVAPASANILAKMAHGLADDLASTLLLASTKPILIAPAMNPAMWQAPATQANLATLHARGVLQVGPEAGDTACGESGTGRMAEAATIHTAIKAFFEKKGPLTGRHALVTAGATREPLDPVRFITNPSSGKQGYAIAAALAQAGANVTLISGITSLAAPVGVSRRVVTTAQEMLGAVQAALPADIAVCCAAVGDFRLKNTASQKIKKTSGGLPALELVENPDILAQLCSKGVNRPALVIGFATETENMLENATAKKAKKGCDWLLANDVSGGDVFGSDTNHVHFISHRSVEAWPRMSKDAVAKQLTDKIIAFFQTK